ncbi:UNVERIFIED_CONTAM: hypothetical protein RMT77_008443 [Armadillidium vulgare]
MRIWAAIFLLAIGANANVGPSGIVNKDGKNVQFSHEFANNIVLIGPSGIVSRDGNNLQLTSGQVSSAVPVAEFITSRGVVGPSGIVRPNGENVQFTQQQVDNFVVTGPSGIVSKDGKNIQFTDDLQFANRNKRSVGFVSRAGNVGTSGILRADGTTDLFDFNTAHNIALIGPSGIVSKDGRNIQFTSDLRIANRNKRSVGFVSPAGNVGTSGIVRVDGTTDLFDFNTAHNIVLIGPSGIVSKDGRNIQFTPDLRIVGKTNRIKRSLPLVGPSGIILEDGTPVQFKSGTTTVLLNGPSGIVLSDGTLVQKRG